MYRTAPYRQRQRIRRFEVTDFFAIDLRLAVVNAWRVKPYPKPRWLGPVSKIPEVQFR